ncbi:hypothetical protein BRC91_11315 [Halobacteriales archaeon QS_4_62_28]|nr:MAG: hypothetical protein BRC91_11315 [Halobacteriales archaeon QS_4_62_28]
MSNTSKPHIELYVRSLVPDGAHTRQEAVIERLETLEREDQIEDFSVIVWGKQVSRESAAAHTEEGKYILNRVAEFKQWALSNNVSLESFYQTTEIQSEFTDDYSAMVVPVMGLAEYSEGELKHVAPCTEGDVVHTIMDRLDRLEAGEPSALEQESRNVSIV